MILNRVQSELDDPENERLSEMQYGFRAGRSTLNAVQVVQKSIDKAFSMKPKPGGQLGTYIPSTKLLTGDYLYI